MPPVTVILENAVVTLLLTAAAVVAAAGAGAGADDDILLYSRSALKNYVDEEGMPSTARIEGGRKLARGSDPMSKKRMIHATRKNWTTSEFTVLE